MRVSLCSSGTENGECHDLLTKFRSQDGDRLYSDIEGLFLGQETRASKCLYIYIRKIWNFNFGSIPRGIELIFRVYAADNLLLGKMDFPLPF